MVLEATVVLLDASEYMRNGDYPPSRLEAQQDALNLVGGAKTGSNPENSVGVITSGGKGVEVLVTLTSDIGKILGCATNVKPGGSANLMAGIQVAQLALKHRQNKNQRQRVIAFVGSPVAEDQAALVRLGKKLKKNAVAVDVVNFGEEAENAAKLEAFINAVNNDDNSHLVTVPPGPHILSDILISSPIVSSNEDGGGAMGGGGGGGGGGDAFAEFGVDPAMDPEFAWALRVSMEEERQRQEAEARARTDAAAAAAPGADMATPAAAGAAAASAGDVQMGDADDEAAMLEAAISMSMAGAASDGGGGAAAAAASAQPRDAPAGGDAPMAEAAEVAEVAGDGGGGDDDEALQAAIAMSIAADGARASPAAGAAVPPLHDPAFVEAILGSLPGVDVNDPRIQAALQGKPEEGDGKEGEQGEGKK
ncbi:hypothetical protein KFE25_001254 [Diacronema lutheri]|uniref:VWFA domain-containing protein n=1 Tax=Diacronema lutheri TaxID=2081491 RepID=A0A8J5X5P7_DIALT|nr:hypothetical protein KFE25_001254 [Diacronema lutheri]